MFITSLQVRKTKIDELESFSVFSMALMSIITKGVMKELNEKSMIDQNQTHFTERPLKNERCVKSLKVSQSGAVERTSRNATPMCVVLLF